MNAEVYSLTGSEKVNPSTPNATCPLTSSGGAVCFDLQRSLSISHVLDPGYRRR
jgi:hypothetical protein